MVASDKPKGSIRSPLGRRALCGASAVTRGSLPGTSRKNTEGLLDQGTAAFLEGRGSSLPDPMYGPAVRRKGIRDGGVGLALMYPTVAEQSSRPSWVSGRIRSHNRTDPYSCSLAWTGGPESCGRLLRSGSAPARARNRYRVHAGRQRGSRQWVAWSSRRAGRRRSTRWNWQSSR